MPDKDDKKREAPISYRPPAELRDEFRARVNKSGMSTNAFITKCCLGADPPRQSRRPAIEEKLLAKLLFEAAAIREQLQKIACTSGADNEHVLLLEQAVEELSIIRAALLKSLGRSGVSRRKNLEERP